MDSSSKILLTGSSGMIGRALANLLKKRGFIHVLAPSHGALELRDQAAVAAYFTENKPEYVFHLAARVGGIHANSAHPGQFAYDNTIMHCNVLEASRCAGVKKLLFPGSACTYPKHAPQPVKATEFLNGHIEPTNLAYASAKISGIVMAQGYAKEYGMKVVIPMPANTYGIGDNFDPAASHVIPGLMTRFYEAKQNGAPEVVLWGTGKPLREFIFADDVADAFLFLMQHYENPDIINVGTMEEISIRELAGLIAEAIGYQGNIVLDTSKPDGAPRKVLDSTPLRSLEWKAKVGLREGIKRMVAHHFPQNSAAAARAAS